MAVKEVARRPLRWLAMALLAVVAALVFALLAALVLYPDLAFAQGFGAPKATPFGLGGAAQPTGIAGFILAKQAEFYRALVQAVRASKQDGNATFLLAGLSFAYGVFHAAGPGHGKAVISSYLLADGGTLKRGAVLALASGMVQAIVAVAFVGVLALALNATAVSMAQAMNWVEIVAYGGIGVFGLYLAIVKGRALVAAARGESVHAHGADCDCGDVHAPDPALLEGKGGWKRAAVAVVSAGARPCSGAILVLTFALSQGVFASGIASAFAMGLGTALMVTLIAAIAVYGKRLAVRLAGRGDRRAVLLGLGVELGAALLVMAFGFALLTGYLESERLLPG
ncbi:nickel/cobalt transporter [Xanthobacter autotrophicus]|uniref:nickel/cobalt transporter n=1 Tax=Xanthobacter autotrophicus TaxID=280 RepID=UPI0024A6B71D|nr:nickel/cobalt transporter [Xanthobacter autotrophicus]MDI4656523.1 nickel/cobalt transporter [Xanthobacter autotrophicus]